MIILRKAFNLIEHLFSYLCNGKINKFHRTELLCWVVIMYLKVLWNHEATSVTMTSICCIVWGISGPLLEKIKKDTLFQGHALHSALWKWRIKGGPEAGDQFLLILHSHISRICRLSYVSNLFSTLVWDFNVLFNFFFLLLQLSSYTVPKGRHHGFATL